MTSFVDHVEAAGWQWREDTISHTGVREAIRAGNHLVSVQASCVHYCEPRANIPFDQYKSYEVGISHADRSWVQPSKELSQFGWFELFGSGGTSSVAGYVPPEIVQQIIDDLCDLGVTEVGS